MRIRAASSALLLFAALAVAGCGTVQRVKNQESLTQLKLVVNTYRKLMRWGHYDQAAQYVKARDGSEILPDFEDMARYKVSSLTIGDQVLGDTEFEAKVTAYFEVYEIDTAVAFSVRDDQLWWYEEDQKRWYLGSPMINFSDFRK